jgi:preprotein translocase subunit SecE
MSDVQSSESGSKPTPRRKARKDSGENAISRAVEFVKESISELRRVVWPTRKQVVTYTIVVLVFVTVMASFVAGIDLLLGRGILRIFGS